MLDQLTVAIISDLHCRTKTSDGSGTTRLHSDQARKPDLKHPVSAIKRLIREKGLKADVVLCPGDITDKADDQGFLSGWDYLKDIKASFGAKHLFATLGNHDVKSRGVINEPFSFAKDLDDEYPVGVANNEEFWAQSFCVIETQDAVYLIFNSSYSHYDAGSAGKCVITDSILENMRNKLDKVDRNKKYKIAMCHHHPIKHFSMDYADDDVMDRGDLFIKLLYDYDFQLLVHGHKHDPRLGVQNSIPILASGSFSSLANLNDIGAENVFHLIKLESKQKKGIIYSYVYKPLKGWIGVKDTHFPFLTGFGSSQNVDTLTRSCGDWFNSLGKGIITYNELVIEIPEIQYLIPDDQSKLHHKLIRDYQLEFVPELYNNPAHLAKQV